MAKDKTHEEQLAEQTAAAKAERDKITEGLKNLTGAISELKDDIEKLNNKK